MMTPMRWCHAVFVTLVTLTACDGADPLWSIDLRTDLAPVTEFVGVQLTVHAADDPDGPALFESERIASRADDYVEGQRIASVPDPPTEQVLLTVALVDGDGAAVATARQLLVPPRNGATVVLVTRSCRSVACGADEMCRDGRCVPLCAGSGCEPTCANAGDCSTMAACAPPACVDGLCLYVDDGSCGDGAYCDAATGCVPLGADDGGVPDAGADAGACGGCSGADVCCDSTCVDVSVDPAHCGGCGVACGTSQGCCSGSCVDLEGDPLHCGACGNECATGASCCALGCVDLSSDDSNCGSCGTTCGPGEACSEGHCCQLGRTYCVSEGSCRDLQNDEDHCGACGNACSLLQSCSDGTCRAL